MLSLFCQIINEMSQLNLTANYLSDAQTCLNDFCRLLVNE